MKTKETKEIKKDRIKILKELSTKSRNEIEKAILPTVADIYSSPHKCKKCKKK